MYAAFLAVLETLYAHEDSIAFAASHNHSDTVLQGRKNCRYLLPVYSNLTDLGHGVVSPRFQSPQVGYYRIYSYFGSVVPVLFCPCNGENSSGIEFHTWDISDGANDAQDAEEVF